MPELYVDSLVYGGAGLGRLDGKAVFVPGAVPGDRILFRARREKKRHVEGEMVSVIDPAPTRIEPHCPVFGRCGGCHWQCLPYAEQLEWKRRQLTDFLVRQAGAAPGLAVTARAAPDPWHYRSRIQLKCHRTPDGLVMGFYRSHSHFVVDTAQCPIAATPLNEAWMRLRPRLAESQDSDRIPQIDLAIDDEGARSLVVHFLGDNPQKLRDALLPLCEELDLAFYLQRGRKETLSHVRGAQALHIHPLADEALRLAYSVGGFAQVNLAQNRALVAELLQSLGDVKELRILDLYCGMGNLSLPLAAKGARVTGVEDFQPAVAMARSNAVAQGLGADFIHAPAEQILDGEAASVWDVVVLDPPRQGAYSVARKLVHCAPQRIVYVSCDPATLARDLKPLIHNGYQVRRAVVLDLFPQTYHIESLVLLERV